MSLDGKGAPVTAEAKSSPITVPVVNAQGQSVGSVEIDIDELGGKVNKQLLHDAVLMYQANQRSGTHSTLRRGEVAGSTKKLFRQKGTGNARAGTRRTNKRRGGGTAKGPKPRDYSYSMPKQSLRIATKMALLSKLQDGAAVIIDEVKLPEIKTQAVVGVLKALKVEKSCLISIGKSEVDEKQTVYKSARNIEGVAVLPASQLNCLAVLRPRKVILTKAALNEICKNAKWK